MSHDDLIAALRADAERYRWLRDHCYLWDVSWQWPQVTFPAVGVTDDSSEGLDAAIDAARAAQEQGR
jgi:hypothetical protein